MTPDEFSQLLEQTYRQLDEQVELPRHIQLGILKPVVEAAVAEDLPRKEEALFEQFAAEVVLYGEPSVWGTQFGPIGSYEPPNGEDRVDRPSLISISEEAMVYWQRRMEEATHPLLRARYADLVWDLSQIITGQRPPYRAAEIAVENYTEAVVNGRCNLYDGGGTYLERPLNLAARLRNVALLELTANRFRDYADHALDADEKEVRLRKLFHTLLALTSCPPNVLALIAADLRQRFNELVAQNVDHFKLNRTAFLLSDYYRSTATLDEAKNVLRQYGEAVQRMADQADALLGNAWLTDLRTKYLAFEMNDEAAVILARIRGRQEEVPGLLVRVETPFEINMDELEQWLANVVTDDLNESVRQIVCGFLPNIAEVREEMQEHMRDHPLAAIPVVEIAHDGRDIARLDHEDPLGLLLRELKRRMHYTSFFLDQALKRLRQTFQLDVERLFDLCNEAPVWPANRHGVLRRALQAYLAEDHIVTIHLLVTEIENSIRHLAESIGVQPLRRNEYGGFELKMLGTLLSDDSVKTFLSSDIVTYMQALLTDQRGWNLRNSTCHGDRPDTGFTAEASNQLMHVVLFLSLLRINDD
jgi:hypothetical protein